MTAFFVKAARSGAIALLLGSTVGLAVAATGPMPSDSRLSVILGGGTQMPGRSRLRWHSNSVYAREGSSRSRKRSILLC